MKKKALRVFLSCLVVVLFVGCALSVSVAIPALNLDFVIKAIQPIVTSSNRADLPGEETTTMHWNDIDTKGRKLRNLHLDMEVFLTTEETLDFTDFDFELYMKENTATNEELLFNAGTIRPNTNTYTWTLDKNNSPAVNQLLNFINEHKETDLVFIFRHNYGEDSLDNPTISYEDMEIKIQVTGTAEVIIL